MTPEPPQKRKTATDNQNCPTRKRPGSFFYVFLPTSLHHAGLCPPKRQTRFTTQGHCADAWLETENIQEGTILHTRAPSAARTKTSKSVQSSEYDLPPPYQDVRKCSDNGPRRPSEATRTGTAPKYRKTEASAIVRAFSGIFSAFSRRKDRNIGLL